MTTQAPAMHKVDWQRDEDIVAVTEQCIGWMEHDRRHFRRKALVNLQWYAGKQWLYYNARSGSLQRASHDPKRANLVYNLLMPYADHQMGQLGMDPINFDVLPATDDGDDIETAQSGAAVLRYYQDKLAFEELIEDVDLWQVLTGEAFVKVIWDATRGPEFDLDRYIGPESARSYTRKGSMIRLGDLDVYTVSPLQMHWGPTGRRFRDADWVLEVNLRTREEIAERYDVDPDELSAGTYANREFFFADDIGASGVHYRTTDQDTLVTAELWRRPSGKLPRGFHGVMCGGKVLRRGPNPYRHQCSPYVRYTMAPIPGQTAGESYVTQCIAPQSEYNRCVSQTVEIREAMASPYILAPETSIVNRAEWDGRPGGLRFYRGAQPPQVVQGVAPSNTILLQQQKTEGVMQDIFGAHDVSRAKVPAGVKSGRAIMALQERDDQRLARVRRRRARCWQDVGRLMLATVAQYVTEPRMIRIRGDDDAFLARQFLGEQLSGENTLPGVDYCDVRVGVNGMPMSRTAQLDVMEMLLQYGVVDAKGNAADKSLVMEALQLARVKRDWDPGRKDRQAAMLENAAMMRGEWIAPRDFDDHDAHLRVHREHCVSGFFRGAEQRVQAAFQAHMREHMVLMAEKSLLPNEIMAQVQAERAAKAAAQGQPPQPSGANVAPPLANAGGAVPESPPA